MKKRLFDSWEADDGMYTREECLERKGIYTRTIEHLQKEIAEMKAHTPAPVDYEERISNLHAMIDCLNDPSIDAKAKNVFLKGFIEKIEFDTVDLGRGKGAEAVLDVYFK